MRGIQTRKKCMDKNLGITSFTQRFLFWTKAAVRRGYIKILLLKNISHLRELSHKFNQNYYVEFSKDLKITELLLQRSGTTHAL